MTNDERIRLVQAGIEAAAKVVDNANREGPYQAIGAANWIRALDPAAIVEKMGPNPQSPKPPLTFEQWSSIPHSPPVGTELSFAVDPSHVPDYPGDCPHCKRAVCCAAAMKILAAQHDFEQVGKVVRSILAEAGGWHDSPNWFPLIIGWLDRLRGIEPLLPGKPRVEVKR